MAYSLLFFDDDQAAHLDPLTLTRPAYDLRLGLTTIREKWERTLDLAHGTGPLRPHLGGVFSAATKKQRSAAAIWINSRYLPTPGLIATIRRRPEGHLRNGDDLVAAWSTPPQTAAWFEEGRPRPVGASRAVEPKGLQRLVHPWDIAGLNPAAIEADAVSAADCLRKRRRAGNRLRRLTMTGLGQGRRFGVGRRRRRSDAIGSMLTQDGAAPLASRATTATPHHRATRQRLPAHA